MRRLFILLAIILIASLVVAACGGGAEEPTPEPAAPVEQPTATPEPAAPAEEPTATPEPAAPAEEPTATPEPAAPVEEPTEAPVEEATAMPAGEVSCDGEGTVLLWHAWTGAEGEVMDQILNSWAEACPSIQVDTLVVSFDELRSKFETSAAAGTGPDFLIGPVDWIGGLAESGLLKELDGFDIDVANYAATAADALRYQGALYAIPESVEAVAMYYNMDLVSAPPTTLDEMLAVAAESGIALNRGFYHAFWGIPAHGGALFDENGVCILDQGGFAEWMDWIAEHQNDAGMNLSTDYGVLNSLFKEGQAGLYPDGPWALGDVEAVLGEGKVGVAPLPAGPGGPSGPFLGVKNIMFSAIPDDSQTELALQVAKFLTNVENQTLLMNDAGHISANVNVEPNNDQVAGFVAQVETAYPFPNIPEMGAVWTPGDDAYTKVLEGVMSGADAAAELCATVNAANNK